MTALRKDKILLPAALPEEESPLPAFRWQQPTPHQPTPPVGLDAGEAAGYTCMGDLSILPYRLQERYARNLVETGLACVILENDVLKVTVVPGLGGRVTSIEDTRTGRELLFRNPVIRTGNLALRNAWFSGGIEWNGGGIPGHAASTMQPVFAHRVDTAGGPILRLHDFDRVTETAWQVDLFLPEDEARLYVHGRIVNPNADARQVYWWTNATVAHQSGQRILSPADYAVEHALPDNHLERFAFPNQWGFDGSYPDNWQSSTSVFFRRPAQSHPWIAACNPDGSGLAQASTATLPGRKFFYFGYGAGGQHWMEFLSDGSGGKYIEVQAGITPTQNNRLTLGAKETLGWTEAYAPLDACADATLGAYAEAERLAEAHVRKVIPAATLDSVHDQLSTTASQSPAETLCEGSPWGALHELLTQAPIANGLDFGTDLPPAWVAVAEGRTPDAAWDDFVTSDLWRTALEALPQDAFTALHLGIIALDREDTSTARRYLEEAMISQPTSVAARCLAVLHAREGDMDSAIAAYARALDLPDCVPETELEFARLLQCEGRANELRAWLPRLSAEARALERMRLLEAGLALAEKNFDRVETLLDFDFATIREGEMVLSDLWWGLVLGRAVEAKGADLTDAEETAVRSANPIPFRLDFVMLREERARQEEAAHG